MGDGAEVSVAGGKRMRLEVVEQLGAKVTEAGEGVKSGGVPVRGEGVMLRGEGVIPAPQRG